MERKILIETDRLLLRQWLPEDERLYIALNLDKEVMEYFPSTICAEESIGHIRKIHAMIDEKGYGLFALERKDNGTFIGFTGLSHPDFDAWFTPCVEIGWRLAKEHWGKGFATEAAKACLRFGFENLSLKEIYSFTAVSNKRSETVMQKAGMEKTGDFAHPGLTKEHPLQKHVLYRISRTTT